MMKKLRGLLKTPKYCCILSLCEACWGLSHAARQMEKPQLTIVLFLMFVRTKKKKRVCVFGGLCMRVFTFITRQKLQRWKLKTRRKRKGDLSSPVVLCNEPESRNAGGKIMGEKSQSHLLLFWHSV